MSLIDELVKLHCDNCDGENYGCRGCTVYEVVEETLKKHNVKNYELNFDKTFN